MSDTISREKAIEALNSVVRDHYINDFDAIACILDLPPAQPEPSQVAKDIARIVENEQDMRVIAQPGRIKGRWILKSQVPDTVRGYWATCSSCGRGSFGGGNFCRECGSDNRKEKEK